MWRIRPWLYIGKYRDTNSPALLNSFQIGAMLQLAEAVPQPGIASLYIAVDDGVPLLPAKLRQGVDFIRAQKAADKIVLSACGAGISRSVTFAIAALKEEEGLSLTDAYAAILDKHPDATPHPALWESLQTYYHDNVTYDELWTKVLQVRRMLK